MSNERGSTLSFVFLLHSPILNNKISITVPEPSPILEPSPATRLETNRDRQSLVHILAMPTKDELTTLGI
jgi:hypothetical protein